MTDKAQSFLVWTPEKGWHNASAPLPLTGRLGAIQRAGAARRAEAHKA